MKSSAVKPSFDKHRGAEAQARVRRIVTEARRLLVERGYQRTSLDAILARSGGSKATLLKYFGNKAGLLGAVLADEAGHTIASAEQAARTGTPEHALAGFATIVLRFYCRQDSLMVYRAIVAEAYRHPTLARRFYYNAHQQFVAALARHLSDWTKRGHLLSADPEADADRFLSMLRSGPHDRALLGLSATVADDELKEQVNACVRLFLHGLGP